MIGIDSRHYVGAYAQERRGNQAVNHPVFHGDVAPPVGSNIVKTGFNV